MNGRRIVFWVVIALVLYFVATQTTLAGSVLNDMGTTLFRWIHDVFSFLTGATGAHP